MKVGAQGIIAGTRRSRVEVRAHKRRLDLLARAVGNEPSR